MAENKKSFIAYSDWHGMFNALPDEIAGKLIKHIFSYVNDEDPSSEDFIINALFEQIKATLKRDLIKWDKERSQRSEAGKKSAESRATKSNERSTEDNESKRNSTVSVSVSDNEIEKSILGSSEPTLPSTEITKSSKEKKKDGGAKIKFQDSEIFDPKKFKDAFPDWNKERLRYYYDSALNYSEQGNKYVNWTSAIRTWASREEFKGTNLPQQTVSAPVTLKNRYKVHG
jgi:DNA mismatch repair ATPase MutL